MFYEKQTKEEQNEYKRMLSLIGKLTLLFSESNCPYLPYRCHENIFCKYFHAENLGRKDCSADAKKNNIGIGLKTWTGRNDQKIAEFGKLREKYKGLTGLELCKKISEYRNERIRITKNTYGINHMTYHIIKRISGKMQVFENNLSYIDIDNITLLENRGMKNNTYFTDKNSIYHFSLSKNTLYMIFDNMTLLDTFSVEIMADPYNYLQQLELKDGIVESIGNTSTNFKEKNDQLCLRLYVMKNNKKIVAERSGLNQWNAKGRVRDPNEIYFPFPAIDKKRNPDFFPSRDTSFNLHLPDGKVISAKVCQDGEKAIMSNPNKDLGKWILRQVFELPEQTILTYDLLENYGIDSVVFTKNYDLDYSIDFGSLGTYETFYHESVDNDIESSQE